MKKQTLDTPRAGSWAETVNNGVVQPKIHVTHKNQERLRIFKQECPGACMLGPKYIKECWDLFVVWFEETHWPKVRA